MTLTSPQQMPHFEGQGKPQRMGTPYYPSLSLSLLPFGIWSPSSVSHQGIDVAAPDVVAKPGDDMMLDLSTIEGIDLNAEIPCGHSEHGALHSSEPAAYVVRLHCTCGFTLSYPLCETGWALFGRLGVSDKRGLHCGRIAIPRHRVLKIVEVLR